MLNNKQKTIALMLLNGDSVYKIAHDFQISPETVTRYKRLYLQEQRESLLEPLNESDGEVKVLFIDIETAYMIVRSWECGKVYINPSNVIADWFMLCFSAKWLGDKDIISHRVTESEAVERDDERIIRLMWRYMDKADVIIAQNGKEFDIKKLNSKFIEYGLNRPSPYLVVDTLEQARKIAKFSSNKLDFLSDKLFQSRKTTTNNQLWIDCENGDLTALKKMSDYCNKDVLLLEKLYLKIRSWIVSHPNLALLTGKDDVCPVCLHDVITWDAGSFTTNVSQFEIGRCKKCGSLLRKNKRHNSITTLTLSR